MKRLISIVLTLVCFLTFAASALAGEVGWTVWTKAQTGSTAPRNEHEFIPTASGDFWFRSGVRCYVPENTSVDGYGQMGVRIGSTNAFYLYTHGDMQAPNLPYQDKWYPETGYNYKTSSTSYFSPLSTYEYRWRFLDIPASVVTHMRFSMGY